MKLVQISMHKVGYDGNGPIICYHDSEESAKAYLNSKLGKPPFNPEQLRWYATANDLVAKSQNIKAKSRFYKDTAAQDYFLIAKDYESVAVKCNCGCYAILYSGHSMFKCYACQEMFYINHCWSCGKTVDSRINKRCGSCAWYICSCGKCNGICVVRKERSG